MSIRQLAKRTIKNLFLAIALPIYGLFLLLARLGGEDATFMGFSQALSLIPGKVGTYLRAAFYRLACPDTSDDISVGFLTLFSHRNTSIHKGVYIGPQCNIGKCTIGANTLIGSGVHVLSGAKQHRFDETDRPIQEQGGSFEKIAIGEDCWVGNQSTVMASVEPHSVIASASVVIKTYDAGDILAGNPARPRRNRHRAYEGTS